MNFLSAKDVLEFIGLISAAVTAIVIATKQGRLWIVSHYKKYMEHRKAKMEMPVILKTIDGRLKRVEYELSPNGGGSMKDSLKIIKAEIEAANWLSPRPIFRCTSNGANIFVNEAYCHLCGVTATDLMRLGWRNFSADTDQMDDFYRRWLIASAELSQFSGKLKIQNIRGEYQGEWIVRIRLLGPIDGGDHNDFLWHGGLYPFDQVAKEYAKQYNIPLFN